jgi:hypothetical protein
MSSPESLRSETSVLAIEGPGWLLQDFEAQWTDSVLRAALLEVIRRTESEPSLGASSHLLGVARTIPGNFADG